MNLDHPKHPVELKIERHDLADAVDYSLDSSVISNESANNLDATRNDETSLFERQQMRGFFIKTGKFRQVVILVLASNRLRFFAKQNKRTSICLETLSGRFYKLSGITVINSESSSKRITTKPSSFGEILLLKNKKCDEKDEINILKSLFTYDNNNNNSDFENITNLANKLNKLLFEENNGKLCLV